jgi:hypothetical protein
MSSFGLSSIDITPEKILSAKIDSIIQGGTAKVYKKVLVFLGKGLFIMSLGSAFLGLS